MPTVARSNKKSKHSFLKFGKAEKDALKALGHLPRFPKKLEGIKKHPMHH